MPEPTHHECEHDEPPEYAAPERVTATGKVIESDEAYAYVAVDSAAGLRVGMTVKVSWVQGGAG